MKVKLTRTLSCIVDLDVKSEAEARQYVENYGIIELMMDSDQQLDEESRITIIREKKPVKPIEPQKETTEALKHLLERK